MTNARKQTTHAHNLGNVLRGCEAPYFFLFVTARGLEENVYPSINPAMALGRNPKAQGDTYQAQDGNGPVVKKM